MKKTVKEILNELDADELDGLIDGVDVKVSPKHKKRILMKTLSRLGSGEERAVSARAIRRITAYVLAACLVLLAAVLLPNIINKPKRTAVYADVTVSSQDSIGLEQEGEPMLGEVVVSMLLSEAIEETTGNERLFAVRIDLYSEELSAFKKQAEKRAYEKMSEGREGELENCYRIVKDEFYQNGHDWLIAEYGKIDSSADWRKYLEHLEKTDPEAAEEYKEAKRQIDEFETNVKNEMDRLINGFYSSKCLEEIKRLKRAGIKYLREENGHIEGELSSKQILHFPSADEYGYRIRWISISDLAENE